MRRHLDLDVSPTAIGNAVASLENRLGVRLFNRTTRNVALTSAGREYVEAIAPALSDIRNATQASQILLRIYHGGPARDHRLSSI
ncbi:MAG TPA: LysR family transcriptional regulator [Pseudolabrys sp.]|nr:LysR family transcriptional regulator [Pseudolabrys sp.]